MDADACGLIAGDAIGERHEVELTECSSPNN